MIVFSHPPISKVSRENAKRPHPSRRKGVVMALYRLLAAHSINGMYFEAGFYR